MSRTFQTGDDPRQVLAHYWGYDDFRPGQLDIVRSILDGHDTLGLMPTGGGKSITFQVPALMLPGLTVVVTPLVSLMKDQVDSLRRRDIRAVCLYSGMSRAESRLAHDRCRLGKAKLLYVAPERLRSQQFTDQLRSWNVSLIVVDEAHCISQWGYDFRPAYLKIADLRRLVAPSVPVLALTASATMNVRQDICRRLEFRDDARTVTLSFARDNLSYIVRRTDNKIDKLQQVLRNTAGSAIVYVRSRVKTQQIAQALCDAGISATYYHAGLDPHVKADRQDAWKNGQIRVMVATNAFGMGIDKPDVRVVVHVEAPPSLEEYYQEAGRAGRDGQHSFAVVLASVYDKAQLTRRLNEAFPPIDYVRRVYELAGNFMQVPVGEGYDHVYDFDIEKFCDTFSLQPGPVRGALALLSLAGWFEFVDDMPSRSRLMITCRRDELYQYNLSDTDDAVLRAVLREYTGLFADFVNITESVIGHAAGVDAEAVYQSMLSLQRQGILQYVPRRLVPYIYYTTSRELPQHVTLPDAVYGQRRRLMQQRLDAVRRFIFSDDSCRAQVILDYFGETDAEPCGHCDICRRRRSAGRRQLSDADAQAIATVIMRILATRPDGIELSELTVATRTPADTLKPILRQLAADGRITALATRILPAD